MSTQEYKGFVERIIQCLRAKREKKENAVVTLDEIFKTMSSEELIYYHDYTLPAFLNKTFADAIRNNPKIHFDLGRKQFTFKNAFLSVHDLVTKLFERREGVVEGLDLYDDVDKEDLEKLKRDGLLREIVIKEKKTKQPLVLLYSKNHVNDDVDKLNLESFTPNILKEYWQKIDKDELDRLQSTKRSAMNYLSRQPEGASARLLNKKQKRKSRFRDEDNLRLWHNNHLESRIEEAFKVLKKRSGEKDKPGARGVGGLRRTGGRDTTLGKRQR